MNSVFVKKVNANSLILSAIESKKRVKIPSKQFLIDFFSDKQAETLLGLNNKNKRIKIF